MKAILRDNSIILQGMPSILKKKIENGLTLENPLYMKLLRQGNTKALYSTQPYLKYFYHSPEGLVIGRGNYTRTLAFLAKTNFDYEVVDETSAPKLDPKIKLKGLKLRKYQQGIPEQIVESSGGIIKLGTGFGKCHGKGTKILMYDGTIKKVEDIKIGDQLMGDDSSPRNVLSLARGREKMYRIIPKKGEPFTCNGSHILSLKSTPKKKGERKYYINISVNEYLQKDDNFKHCHKLWKTGVDFEDKEVGLDPYFIGVWLGDGSNRTSEIHNPDKEIEKYSRQYAKELGLSFRKYIYNKRTCPLLHITTKMERKKEAIISILRKYNLVQNKHIPFDYKVNSREKRLRLLAGLIDSDGYKKETSYEIITKYSQLKDDILFLCNSLGFMATYKVKRGGIKERNFSANYYRISINGDLTEVPIKIKRKKPQKRKQKKDVNVTSFSIERLGEGDYYGFEIDGNRLYLLDNFFVTHNTIISLKLIDLLRTKTLIIVPRNNILTQFKNEIEKYFSLTPGRIQSKKFDIDDITLASMSTIKKRDLKSIRNKFGMVIVDECHTAISDACINALKNLNPRYLYGMTASPEKSEDDGRTDALKFVYGDIVVDKELPQQKPEVKVVPTDCDILTKYNYPETITEQIENQDRMDLTVQIIKQEIAQGRRILVLTKRVEHYQKMFCVSSGGNKKEKDQIENKLEKLKNGDTDFHAILGTYSMLSMGIDIPALDTLLFAGDLKTDVLTKQSAGRIMRLFEGKKKPRIIDMQDNRNPILHRQFLKRKKFYEKNGWEIK